MGREWTDDSSVSSADPDRPTFVFNVASGDCDTPQIEWDLVVAAPIDNSYNRNGSRPDPSDEVQAKWACYMMKLFDKAVAVLSGQPQ
ncbi:hypothetical protein Poly59_31580 [Rubripirellula reticaptiva]|uniref:Uncharacterized protein n=2 Tax=Rubripirellula reticaptiva TaxID=2528013 RepID=A0A5C6ESE5_9BACT|nr:hypothetical protein Poly59_31580 [Rubripirellula reticaptiva]